MDIKGLRYFIAAAERLNFTTAAKECYITQTAMSLHISKMETELGFKLFDRNKRVVELTEAGKDFLRQAQRLVSEYDNAVRHSLSIAGGLNGIIRAVLPSCMDGFVLMDKFRAYSSSHPGIELNLTVEPPDKLLGLLKNRQTDVIFGYPYEIEMDSDCNILRLFESPGMVICSKDHPFAKEGKITADMLTRETFAFTMPDNMPLTFRQVRNKWRAAGFDPQNFISVKNVDEILMMVDLGRCVAIVPEFVRTYINQVSSGVYCIDCEYETEPPPTIISLGYMPENPNPVLDGFLKYFKNETS